MTDDVSLGMGAVARRFLGSIVALVRSRWEPEKIGVPPEPSWIQLAEEIVGIAQHALPPELRFRPSTPLPPSLRTLAMAHWAIRMAGLMAAPESGLGRADAEAWLQALIGTFDAAPSSGRPGPAWAFVRNQLWAARRRRLEIAERNVGTVNPNPDLLVKQIEQVFAARKGQLPSPTPWHMLVEAPQAGENGH